MGMKLTQVYTMFGAFELFVCKKVYLVCLFVV